MKRPSVIALSCLMGAAVLASAADWRLADQVYRNVRIKEVTASSVIIVHDGGISKIPLADLPPEAQERFGYDPAAAAAEAMRRRAEDIQAEKRAADMRARLAAGVGADASVPGETLRMTRLKRSFGATPVIRQEVDLRPTLRELGLTAKDQGRRPSCAVFAVVAALEYLSAQAGQPTRFSEDYAIWATRRALAERGAWRSEEYPDEDAGFRLTDVTDALERYGLMDYDTMPNTFGSGMSRIEPPEPAVLQQARHRLTLETYRIDADDPDVSIEHLIHCLNAGEPVVIGLAWPSDHTLFTAPLLSNQTPLGLHAVTLVGYRADDESGENLRFVFKNSWGLDWGSGGYGWVTADYLRRNLDSAMILDPKFER